MQFVFVWNNKLHSVLAEDDSAFCQQSIRIDKKHYHPKGQYFVYYTCIQEQALMQ